MIGWNNVIEMELIEQLALITLQPPHHPQPPLNMARGWNLTVRGLRNRLLQQNLPRAVVRGTGDRLTLLLSIFPTAISGVALISPRSPTCDCATAWAGPPREGGNAQ